MMMTETVCQEGTEWTMKKIKSEMADSIAR